MTTPRRPPGRYDEQRPLPRAVLIGGGVVLGVALLGLAYAGYSRFSTDRVQFGTIAYKVTDDTTTQIRFQVDKDLTETVQCQLVARDADHTNVGSRTVTVGPAERQTVVTTSAVTTVRRAKTGEVVGCAVVKAPAP